MMGIVMEVVGRFFFLTFPDAVSDAGSIGMAGLFSLMVVIGLFFTTSVMIVNTCVNLIHIVPDAVLAWIAPGTQSSGSGSRMNGEFAQAAGGMAGYGGAIAKQSMMKSRESGKAAFAGSAAGKKKAAQDMEQMVGRMGKGGGASGG
jgi:hypothetical protein